MKQNAKFIYLFLAGFLMVSAGCDTFPLQISTRGSGQDNGQGQLDRENAEQARRTSDQNRRAAEEARRAAEEQERDTRRAKDEERHASERQRDEAKQLREKFEKYSTGELVLMHERYLELATGSTGRDLNVRVNALLPTDTDKNKMEKVIEIERELLRRWKAGDQDAKLPIFK